VLSVQFSPDGKHLASGSGDTTVRLWNHETQSPKFTCKGHTNWVLCIAWSPDGRVVASGGMDKDVRLWDPETGTAVGGAMKGHKKHITALAWEPAHIRYPPIR
jgi:ribosome assembly protein 4